MKRIAESGLRLQAFSGFKCACRTVKQNLSANVYPSESPVALKGGVRGV